jgi:AraC-like DNA-binding protein
MATRLLALLTQMLTDSGSDDQPQWLQTACALLNADFNQPCTLENIAQAAGLTYHTFRRLFEQATGLAPAQYRFARRMEAACSLLLLTQLPLRDIAERLNFSDESHFSNRFQWYTGVRPSRYRHEGRRGDLPLPSDNVRPENALLAGSSPKDFE